MAHKDEVVTTGNGYWVDKLMGQELKLLLKTEKL